MGNMLKFMYGRNMQNIMEAYSYEGQYFFDVSCGHDVP